MRLLLALLALLQIGHIRKGDVETGAMPGFLKSISSHLPISFISPSPFVSSQDKLQIGREEFAQRRATLTERLGDGAIVLDAGPLQRVGDDANTPIFDFKYLAGIHDEDGILVIVDKKATLFVKDPASITAPVEAVLKTDAFEAWAAKNLAAQAKIHIKLRPAHKDLLSKAAPEAKLVGSKVGAELTRMRLVKSTAEANLIRKASEASCKAHLAAMKALKPGMNEKEIQETYEVTFKKEGCTELGYPPICGAGMNGTILHYFENSKEIAKDTLMVCDCGGGVDNYVTDITRTMPTSGRFSETQRKHYQCVLDAQKAAETVLKPGATFGDLERAAQKVFADRGLTRWSYAHSKDRSVRHGLGHYVGMAVHDSGTYSEKFEPGMVITIEPGWYDKDNGYGIRIEDIYLVTAGGFERLSTGVPREIDEIEKIMAGKKDY